METGRRSNRGMAGVALATCLAGGRQGPTAPAADPPRAAGTGTGTLADTDPDAGTNFGKRRRGCLRGDP
jgi:hypothetical protein